MPKHPSQDSKHWVRVHVKTVRPDSTTRQLSRRDRCTFYEYVALARWQKPYRGCLSDVDGRAWTRQERATLIGETYSTTKRTEDKLVEAGLITFQSRGVAHKDAVGRLHIVKYEQYQPDTTNSESASKTEGQPEQQPSLVKATASKTEGQPADQPSPVEARVSEKSAFTNEGQKPAVLRPDSILAESVQTESASKTEGQDPVVLNDVNDVVLNGVEGDSTHQALIDNCLKVLGDLTRQGGAQMTVENCISSHELAPDVILAECNALATRLDEGQGVHLSYLPRNVLQAAEREAEARKKGETTVGKGQPKYRPPQPASAFEPGGDVEQQMRDAGHRIAGDEEKEDGQDG